MLTALTHNVPPTIADCAITFVDRKPIDFELARYQHDSYCAVLEQLGVNVLKLSGNESYPDACFVEDTALVLNELAVICSMGISSRRGETKIIERELSRYRKIFRISLPGTIEGGDILRVGKTIFVGQSRRTNVEGFEQLASLVRPHGYATIPVEVKRVLHLKSACTAIDDETLFVNPDWVELEALRGFKLVNTPRDEPDSANVLQVGKTVCVQAAFPRAIELLYKLKQVEIVDTSELRKAEAGLTCSSIIFQSEV